MANESIKAAREFLEKQGANEGNTGRFFLDASIKSHAEFADEQTRDLRERLEAAKESLELWKCSYCSGRKVVDYREGAWAPWKESTCPECNGSGLNKVANEALKELQEKL
jgi:hypothetical protein